MNIESKLRCFTATMIAKSMIIALKEQTMTHRLQIRLVISRNRTLPEDREAFEIDHFVLL